MQAARKETSVSQVLKKKEIGWKIFRELLIGVLAWVKISYMYIIIHVKENLYSVSCIVI